ncbi:MAG: DUF1460 domain-containing protein, partial [Syntrophales bacterium]|nr:DUF1460 domain-containing protein [Syntrophales bacterium]
DVTPDLGGSPLAKEINYMTRHPECYTALSDPAVAAQMEGGEKELANQALFFIPVSAFEEREHRIKDGDIIGITTDEAGLDVMHAGLAVYRGEAPHLLHASLRAGKVIISEETLGDYLRAGEKRTGVMVGRIV